MLSCARGSSGKRVSNRIDRELLKSARDQEDVVKLLLLGAGESGKSTIVKQMKIIHGDGYSNDELKNFKTVVHSNLLTSVTEVINATEKLNIQMHHSSNQAHAMEIITFSSSWKPGSLIPSNVGEKMQLVWKDDGFQECLKRACEYYLSDYAPYYFQKMEKILEASYIPNEQDVLQSRVPTTGIVETSFKNGGITYHLFDVGGQRSERRKWLHCFDDVKAVLFVASLSGYNMTLNEDGTTNRMEESLNLFQAICYNKFFDEASIILFLNKIDLFTEKINNTTQHLRHFFPQYTGPDHNVPAAQEFIRDQFLGCNLRKDRLVYPHYTTATDTNNIKIVFKVVLETITHNELEDANLMWNNKLSKTCKM